MKTQYRMQPPLETRTLINGATVRLYDLSRRLAGDRWLVRLCCETHLALTPELLQACPLEEPELQAEVLARLGDSLFFPICKEKHFVDEAAREQVREELIRQVHETLMDYIGNPAFPARLFRKQYEEAKQLCLRERQRPGDEGPEEEGPADFSACFRD